MEAINCMLVKAINTTLDTCNYTLCSNTCRDYLWTVANNCPHVFNNETYEELWRTLISLCYGGH